MRISSFKVSDFRSISHADVPLENLTCLVGPNNVGKSNILHALVMATAGIIGRGGMHGPLRGHRRKGPFMRFDGDRDLPIGNDGAQPFVDIDFRLTGTERNTLEEIFAESLDGDLRIHVNLRTSQLTITHPTVKGDSAEQKQRRMLQFIRSRLRLEYIPAVRTGEQAIGVIDRLISDQMKSLQDDDEYKQAIARVQELEEKPLREMEDALHESLNTFIPDLQSVSLGSPGLRRRYYGAYTEVHIDDGVSTDIEVKGDGVQSLAAIALARHWATHTSSDDHHLILAVEEPETHLHPSAIRNLRGVLRDISESQQVIMTTHSPLLVNVADLSTTIIVDSKEAKAANSARAVRDCLGIQMADNLTSAMLVLLVEGDTDMQCMRLLLSDMSEQLENAFEEGILGMHSLEGVSHLSYQCSVFNSLACPVYAFLDNDGEAVKAVAKAKEARNLESKDYQHIVLPNMRTCELEDLFAFESYAIRLEEILGFKLNRDLGNTRGVKWSKKLKGMLRAKGKSEDEVGVAKRALVDVVSDIGRKSLHKEGDALISELVELLQHRLS